MLQKSKAIVIHSIRYSESSLIAHVYAEAHGRLSLLVRGAYGKKKSAGKAMVFQPSNLIDAVYYIKSSQGICTLKEASLEVNYSSIPSDPRKRAIAMFCTEVLYRTVREEEANPSLFSFLENSFLYLDGMAKGVENFHLIFMSQLTRFVGIYPGNGWSEATPLFDYKNGLFVANEPRHTFHFAKPESKLLGLVLATPYQASGSIALNQVQRRLFIENMLTFYNYHNSSVSALKSLPVLIQVFEA